MHLPIKVAGRLTGQFFTINEMNYFNLDQSIIIADDETVVLPRSSSLSEACPGCTSFGTC
jgi:hypothetical protein